MYHFTKDSQKRFSEFEKEIKKCEGIIRKFEEKSNN